MEAKLGSLFDGIGGFPLAGLDFGIVPIWASEIEPFPIRVTKERFPDMQHVGDITKLNGADLPLVDIITGGSPCQDLSVAGKRAGLQGERSGLFMEQVRVIKEMRAKHGRPRFMVWENVPGAFSSAGGEDFRAVIEETARIAETGVSIPRPADGKWAGAGCIMGDTWSIAWRVLDAQFWGVPQRRRRIFLVADFGGQSAPEILFKHESVSGNTAESGTQGEGAAEGAEGGARTAICPTLTSYNLDSRSPQSEEQQHIVGAILRAERGAGAAICLNDQGGQIMDVSFDVTGTLRHQMGGHLPLTLQMREGKAHGHEPAVYCLQGNVIDRADTAGCNGSGWCEDVSYTLNTIDRPAVTPICMAPSFSRRPMQQIATNQEDISYAITTNEPPRVLNTQVMFAMQRSDEFVRSDASHILSRRDYKDATDLVIGALQASDYKGVGSQYVQEGKCIPLPLGVRRLTPLECERLQGFPDGWTDIPKATDSARYKALGNSVAIPCVKFVLQGIAEEISKGGN